VQLLKARRKAGPLGQALRYRNRDVVETFAERFQLPAVEAGGLFDDTKRWLWLSAQPDAPPMHITTETRILDEVWHTFVLYTEAYAGFCQTRFGRFLHHEPTSPRAKRRLVASRARDPERYARTWRRVNERRYQFIADKLGADILTRWYVEYPLRYDGAFFRRAGLEADDLPPAVVSRLSDLLAASA
jgi:hypothetical protein